jgi:ubiquinone/menaquinone biosynthesis C-methylase UbiE
MLNYDHLAVEYAKHRKIHPGVMADMVSNSKLTSSSRVLEVGCGTCNYLLAIQQATGCTCYGIDPSQEMLAKAQERSTQLILARGKGEKLDFPDATFDLVFSVDVIHHVVDRQGYFFEAFRALRAGGKCCTVTDSEWIIHHRIPLTAYFPETVPIELQRYPRIPDLEMLMTEAGFNQITSKMVEFPYLLVDIQPYRDKAFSSLHLIKPDEYRRGIEHMEHDLAQSPIPCISYYLLLWGQK